MKTLILSAVFAIGATVATAQCGGSFNSFVQGLKAEAMAKGHSQATVDAFFRGVQQDAKTLRADRSQGVFQKPFIDFSRALISQNRIDNGVRNYGKWRSVFDRIQQDYGVNPGVLLAFWAFETDYGTFQGNFNTRNSLVTLAHDCRRPELFRPQVLAAIELYERGGMDPQNTTGAWAGEIGMVQMLPEDILTNGKDGDGDGRVSLKTSAPDALMSGAAMLSDLGWAPNQPWLQEVIVPDTLDWSKTGLDTEMSVADWRALGVQARTGNLGPANLQASVILPQGRKGPAFIAYPNFRVYFEWNQSFVYVTTAAYFGTRLEGAPVYRAGNPDTGLTGDQMIVLQQKLQARGYDVGKVDGILGARTRAAVQSEQARLGLPADAWPTPDLLNRL
ncbi:lytic murein transglycosylase [Shimia ponticola]|uniref:lytic murein transglycosylase n=1 Tax=Shimia ponticola TaxID=2582893 RepID=UPI0011BE98ED|nr:lytic murein transglycosylase [Shimia ponticola]